MRHARSMAGAMVAVVLGICLLAHADAPATRPTTNPNATRVACIGDSITEGFTIDHPEANGYPAVLNRLLGPDYDVRNFGAGGTTCLLHGDDPYTRDPRHMFEKATAFAPQIVVIMLGTNDSKPQNQTHKDEFAGDLAALVGHFSGLATKPKIYLCLPAPAFSGAFGISNDAINTMLPQIRQVAAEEHATLVDTNAALRNSRNDFPDGIHPNAVGAKRLAETVAAAMKP